MVLTHWGRVTDICIGNLNSIGSDNGLSPGRCQAIIWTNAGILLIRPLGTLFSGILSKIHTFSFNKMHLKTSSAKLRPFCLSLNVLNQNYRKKEIMLFIWHHTNCLYQWGTFYFHHSLIWSLSVICLSYFPFLFAMSLPVSVDCCIMIYKVGSRIWTWANTQLYAQWRHNLTWWYQPATNTEKQKTMGSQLA